MAAASPRAGANCDPNRMGGTATHPAMHKLILAATVIVLELSDTASVSTLLGSTMRS